MQKYKVLQSLVGDQFCWHPLEVIEWPDAEDAARLVAAGVLVPISGDGAIENQNATADLETPEGSLSKRKKKETR